MPDHRSHRGPDPRDAGAFAPEMLPAIRAGVDHLSWLLTRGYAWKSALKIVGDRWGLTDRQRMAALRCSCPDGSRDRREAHRTPIDRLRGEPLVVDGFNVLTTIEAALGGAPVLLARDGCFRDLAGVHGTYRKVEETRPAIDLVGEFLADRGVGPCLWCLDSPVSNSGRLAAVLREVAEGRGWDWSVELMFNPDARLASAPETVATADAMILDRSDRWANLAREAIEGRVPGAWVVDLSGAGPG